MRKELGEGTMSEQGAFSEWIEGALPVSLGVSSTCGGDLHCGPDLGGPGCVGLGQRRLYLTVSE